MQNTKLLSITSAAAALVVISIGTTPALAETYTYKDRAYVFMQDAHVSAEKFRAIVKRCDQMAERASFNKISGSLQPIQNNASGFLSAFSNILGAVADGDAARDECMAQHGFYPA